MSFITKDTFPIDEVKKFLIGKPFCHQSEVTLSKVTGVIEDVSLSFKMVFIAEYGKAFFKPVIQVKSTKGVWYNFSEIWVESVMPFKDYGGAVVTIDGVNNPFPNGIKLPKRFINNK